MLIDHQFQRLWVALRVQGDRLIKIDVLSRDGPIINQHLQIAVLVLGVSFAQGDADGARVVISRGFFEAELVVVPLAFLLQSNELVMVAGDVPAQLRPRRLQITVQVRFGLFQIGLGFGNLLLAVRQLLLLVAELLLNFCQRGSSA